MGTTTIKVPVELRDRINRDAQDRGMTAARLTEQPRTVTRERLVDTAGVVDSPTMRDVDLWLRDFLALP
jgi:hypothetical protein